MVIIWWFHHRVLGHGQQRARVTVPLRDLSRGILVKCDCGKVWAQ